VADINSLPIENGAYDLVISCEVLEHLQEPHIALKEIKRVSKGLCLISVPHEPYFSMMNFLSGKNLMAFGNDPEHLQRWTKREFKELLAKEFEIISLGSSLPWLIALCRINKKST
jgi:ubiquinone/menaquinone biosynthesis C-methylase UbiE